MRGIEQQLEKERDKKLEREREDRSGINRKKGDRRKEREEKEVR